MDDKAPTAINFHEDLKLRIRTAAKDGPSLQEFLRRLAALGVSLVPKVNKSGRVANMAYRFGGKEVKASELGIEFTWAGIRRLGVQYDRDRDFQLMLSHLPEKVRADATSGPISADKEKQTGQTAGLLAEKLDQLRTLERKLHGVFDDIRKDGTRQLNQAMNALRGTGASAKPTLEVGASQTTIADSLALGASVEALRADVQNTLERMDGAAGVVRSNDDATVKLLNDFQRSLADQIARLTERVDRLTTMVSVTTDADAKIETGRRIEKRVSDFVNKVDSSMNTFTAAVDEAKKTNSAALYAQMAQASSKLSESVDRLSNTAFQTLDQAQKSIQAVETAAVRLRSDSFWMSIVSATIAALVTGVVVGTWAEQEMGQTRREVMGFLEKQASDDPLRSYFNKLLEKMK